MSDQSNIPQPLVQDPHASIVPSVPTDEGRPQYVGVMPQALPTAVMQSDDLNPVHPKPSAKETAPKLTIEPSADLPTGVQSVETMRTPEIPLEIEKYIEEVKDHQDQIPQEIVLTDQKDLSSPLPKTLSHPVIILPMTKEELQESKKASVKMSKRWLGVWVEKVMQMFSGDVVYRDKQLP